MNGKSCVMHVYESRLFVVISTRLLLPVGGRPRRTVRQTGPGRSAVPIGTDDDSCSESAIAAPGIDPLRYSDALASCFASFLDTRSPCLQIIPLDWPDLIIVINALIYSSGATGFVCRDMICITRSWWAGRCTIDRAGRNI